MEKESKNNKKVYNSALGRLIRTVGYLLILLGSLLLTLDVLRQLNISFLNDWVTIINDSLVINLGRTFMNFKFLYVISGLLILIVLLSKSITYRIITILLLFFTVININLTGAYFFPNYVNEIVNIGFNVDFLKDFFNNYINNNHYLVLIINLLTPLFIYLLIASKKPTRFATQLVSSAMMLLFVVFIFHSLPLVSDATIFDNDIFNSIKNYVVAGSTLAALIGSALGVLGVFRS